MPWELLTLRASGQHLDELPGTLIRYAWPETRTTPETSAASSASRPEGGRILMAWSAAGGALPAGQHQTAIQRACQRGFHRFEPERDVIAHFSLDKLDDALASASRDGDPVAVLHILAHGYRQGQAFGLVSNRDRGDDDHSDDDHRTGGGTSNAIIDPGRLRQLLAPYADHLRLVVLCVCDGGNMGELGNHLGSFAQTLHRAGIQSVVASRSPLSAHSSVKFSQALYHNLLAEPASLEKAFTHARRTLARDADSLGWASLQLYARPPTDSDDGDDTRPVVMRPYRGLLPFRAEHARFFVGRTAEAADILSHLQTQHSEGKPRFLVVAGASGTGKSSVVMAGALPQLMADSADAADSGYSDEPNVDLDVEGALRTLELLQPRLGDADIVQQAMALVRQRCAESSTMSGGRWDAGVMRVGKDPMRALEATLATRRHGGGNFLLIVDQFEELFTAVDDADVRQRFAQRLWSLASAAGNVYCIITIRVDFLGQCGDIILDSRHTSGRDGVRLDQVAYDEQHRVFVAHMRPEQVRAAIAEPARLVGLAFEPGLIDTIMEEVGAEPGVLPLLQYTLDLLWQRRRGRTLCADAYHALGGVTGALQRKADALIDDFDEAQEQQARRLLVRLVGIDDDMVLDTRRRVAIDDLRPAASTTDNGTCIAFDYVLDAFVGARLLVRGEDGGVATVEVAHEALIRKWARLRKWLHEDRDKLVELEELRTLVQNCREYNTLLQGQQLGYAVQVREKYGDDLDPAMAETIAASVESDTRMRRRGRRRVQAVLTASLTVAVVMAILGSWANYSANRAVAEQERAESALQVAESERQRAESERQRAEEEERKALLAAENERAAAIKERQAAERARKAQLAAEEAAQRESQAKAEAERRAQLETEAKAEAVAARDAEAQARLDEERARRQAEAMAAEQKRRADHLQQKLDGSLLDKLPSSASEASVAEDATAKALSQMTLKVQEQ